MSLTPLSNPTFSESTTNSLGQQIPASGYLVYTFLAGTTTKTPTYTDYTQNTANPNPVILNSRGEASIWLPPNLSYKVVFTTPSDNQPANNPMPSNPIWTQDYIQGGVQFNSIAVTGNTTLSSANNNQILLCNAVAGNITITPLTAVSAGKAFIVYLKKVDSSGNTVTFTPPGLETVDGQTSFVLSSTYQSASFFSDGNNWFTLNNSLETVLTDTAGNNVISTNAISNAANSIQASAATGGNPPTLKVIGTDTSQRIKLEGLGTDGLLVTDGSNNSIIQADNGAIALNYNTTITGNASVSGTLTTGAITAPSGISITGNGTVTGTLSSTGNGTFNNTELTSSGATAGKLITHTNSITNNRTVTWPDVNISNFITNNDDTVLVSDSSIITQAWSTTEGSARRVMTVSYTPALGNSRLRVWVVGMVTLASISGNGTLNVGLFNSSALSTFCGLPYYNLGTQASMPFSLFYTYSPGSTYTQTFYIDLGYVSTSVSGTLKAGSAIIIQETVS